jgi:hypothetical protein
MAQAHESFLNSRQRAVAAATVPTEHGQKSESFVASVLRLAGLLSRDEARLPELQRLHEQFPCLR